MNHMKLIIENKAAKNLIVSNEALIKETVEAHLPEIINGNIQLCTRSIGEFTVEDDLMGTSESIQNFVAYDIMQFLEAVTEITADKNLTLEQKRSCFNAMYLSEAAKEIEADAPGVFDKFWSFLQGLVDKVKPNQELLDETFKRIEAAGAQVSGGKDSFIAMIKGNNSGEFRSIWDQMTPDGRYALIVMIAGGTVAATVVGMGAVKAAKAISKWWKDRK